MMKSLMAAAASLALIGGVAYAGQKTLTELPTTTTSAQAGLSEAELLGKPVYDSTGQKVGEIQKVDVGEDGTQHAVIEVGTKLGLGSKKIAVATTDLAASADGAGYNLAMSAEDIEAMPEYAEPGAEGDADTQ